MADRKLQSAADDCKNSHFLHQSDRNGGIYYHFLALATGIYVTLCTLLKIKFCTHLNFPVFNFFYRFLKVFFKILIKQS